MIARPSFQSLYIEMCFNGISTACGTAFIYSAGSRDFLVTNRHNFTGRDQTTGHQLSDNNPLPSQVRVFHNRPGRIFDPVVKIEDLYDAHDNPLWIEHPTLGSKFDCVALSLQRSDDALFLPYNEYDNMPILKLEPSEPVSVIGYPFGLRPGGASPVWATGFIASEPDINFNNLPMFLIDCRARKGQSGSPVIAYRPSGFNSFQNNAMMATNQTITNFLGIYSGRVNKESDLGMVWKAAAIRELILHAALN